MEDYSTKAMELLKSWVATKASPRFVFSLDSVTLVCSPKLPLLAAFDEFGRLLLTAGEWIFRFSLEHAVLGLYRFIENEADSIMISFPDGRLNIFAFNPALPKGATIQ